MCLLCQPLLLPAGLEREPQGLLLGGIVKRIKEWNCFRAVGIKRHWETMTLAESFQLYCPLSPI